MSVDEMENENANLKERVKELENALMPPPIFSSPIATMQPWKSFDRTPESSSRLRGTSSLLVAVRRYVGENIKKRMSLVLETWELANNFISLGSRMTNLRQYLQVDLENDEEFYKGVVTTFVMKVSNMSELKRKEEDLPSLVHIKQLKACWIKRIKCLKEILVDLDTLSVKKGESYLKLVELDLAGTTREVDDPKIILNSIFMTKEQFEKKLESLKSASTERFNSLTEYSEFEVESWLVNYVNKNEDIEDTLHQISIDYREIEDSLFDIRVRQEIIVTPMRDYIENWLKQALIKIMETDQEMAVTNGQRIPTKENTKGTSTEDREREKSITVSKLITSE
jgi:hypothetical protein